MSSFAPRKNAFHRERKVTLEMPPFLDESVQVGMITIESVRMLKYRARRPQERP